MAILYLAFIIGVATAACPNGFTHYGTECYKVNTITGTWSDAFAYCETMKGHLLAIETAAEKAIIEGMIADLHLSKNYWLDATNLHIQTSYTWMHSGEKVTFDNWAPGQPNNGGGMENCMVMETLPPGHTWNDYDCTGNHIESICETKDQ